MRRIVLPMALLALGVTGCAASGGSNRPATGTPTLLTIHPATTTDEVVGTPAPSSSEMPAPPIAAVNAPSTSARVDETASSDSTGAVTSAPDDGSAMPEGSSAPTTTQPPATDASSTSTTSITTLPDLGDDPRVVPIASPGETQPPFEMPEIDATANSLAEYLQQEEEERQRAESPPAEPPLD